MPEPLDPLAVQSLEDLIAFARALSEEEGREDWENTDTSRFLEAMAAWADASWRDQAAPMHGYNRPEQPSWQAFAVMLRAGTVYE